MQVSPGVTNAVIPLPESAVQLLLDRAISIADRGLSNSNSTSGSRLNPAEFGLSAARTARTAIGLLRSTDSSIWHAAADAAQRGVELLEQFAADNGSAATLQTPLDGYLRGVEALYEARTFLLR